MPMIHPAHNSHDWPLTFRFPGHGKGSFDTKDLHGRGLDQFPNRFQFLDRHGADLQT